jgi:hypothetical protein
MRRYSLLLSLICFANLGKIRVLEFGDLHERVFQRDARVRGTRSHAYLSLSPLIVLDVAINDGNPAGLEPLLRKAV